MAQYEPFIEFYGYQPIESIEYFESSKEKYEKKAY